MKTIDIYAFWHSIITQSRATLPGFFHPDAIIRWHCTNEQFTVEEYVKVNCDYPNDWEGEIERVEENGDTIVLVGRVFPKDKSESYHVVSFIKVRDGKVAEMDEYWADDGEVPKWRADLGIGKKIK